MRGVQVLGKPGPFGGADVLNQSLLDGNKALIKGPVD